MLVCVWGCGKKWYVFMSGLGTAGPESRRVRLHMECASSGDLQIAFQSGHMTDILSYIYLQLNFMVLKKY